VLGDPRPTICRMIGDDHDTVLGTKELSQVPASHAKLRVITHRRQDGAPFRARSHTEVREQVRPLGRTPSPAGAGLGKRAGSWLAARRPQSPLPRSRGVDLPDGSRHYRRRRPDRRSIFKFPPPMGEARRIGRSQSKRASSLFSERMADHLVQLSAQMQRWRMIRVNWANCTMSTASALSRR
jgi:hypothetical protein